MMLRAPSGAASSDYAAPLGLGFADLGKRLNLALAADRVQEAMHRGRDNRTYSLKQKIPGCVFAGRCPKVTDLCRQVAPALEEKARSMQAVATSLRHLAEHCGGNGRPRPRGGGLRW